MSEPVRHLLVDARPIDHPTARQRGIGRYVTGLLRGLDLIDAPFTALVASDREADLLVGVVDPDRIRRWSPRAVGDHANPGTWYVATQMMLHPVSRDPIPRAITEAALPVAAVMYDVIPYRYPERYQVDPPARALARVRAPLARTVDVMLAISDFAAETASQELGFDRELIATIGAGVDSIFAPAHLERPPRPDSVLPADVGRYVVSVSGGDERKNTEGLLRAWAEVSSNVRSSHRLVVVGAHDREVFRQWRNWADAAGVTDDVIFTGGVSDVELVALLQGADLAVMPSLEEGFGLPVLEAAACGCAVICSNLSSLPEVLDEPAAVFDPHQPSDIAAAIDRAIGDESHRAVLLEAGARAAARWTWSHVASETMNALEDLGPRGGRAAPRQPGRTVGIAGPFEDSATATGRRLAEFAGALSRVAARLSAESLERHDVRSILRLVDVSATPSSSSASFERWPVRAVGRFLKPWDFDHVIVNVGIPLHDVATTELTTSVPCHVWIHDIASSDLHVEDVLNLARSVIVGSESDLVAARGVCASGPPVLVMPAPVAAAPGSAAPESAAGVWTFDDAASALIAWLDEVETLAPDAIRRVGPGRVDHGTPRDR